MSFDESMSLPSLEELFANILSTDKKVYQKNQLIFRQGDPVLHLFVLDEGGIRLERYTFEGRIAVMQTARAGETLAEASLFSDVYHCNAVATMTSRLTAFLRTEIIQALSERPQLALAYISHLSAQIRNLRTRLELSNTLSARERVLQFLLLSVDAETGQIELGGTLKDLAEELGLAHETFYRELKVLEKKGVVQRKGRCIKIKPQIS